MKAYLCDPEKNTTCPEKGSALCTAKSFEGCRWTTERACAAEDRKGVIYEISVPSGSSPSVNGNRGVMPEISGETVAILRQALPEYFGEPDI